MSRILTSLGQVEGVSSSRMPASSQTLSKFGVKMRA